MALEEVLYFVGSLEEDFSASFVATDADAYGVKMEISFMGKSLGGRLEVTKRSVDYERAATFVAD